jgi:hypothetical protein
MNGKRGPAGFFLVALALLALGACTSQQTRDALGFFGLSRTKPTVTRTEPAPPAPAPAKPAEEDEPVPVAAPRIPVETDRVAPPQGGSTPASSPAGSPAPRARPRS